MTVLEFARTWLRKRELDGRRQMTTVVRERNLLACHVLPALGGRTLTELTWTGIDTLCRQIAAEVNPRTGKEKAHTARLVAVMRRKMLRDAIGISRFSFGTTPMRYGDRLEPFHARKRTGDS